MSSFKQELLDDVEGKKPKLQELDEAGNRVIHDNPDDFSVQSETRFLINKVRQPLDRTLLKLNERKAKLHNILANSQEIQELVDDTDDRLTRLEKIQEKQRPVSPEYDTIKKQHLENTSVLEDLDQLEPLVELLEARAQRISDDTEPENSKGILDKVDDFKSRLVNVKQKAKGREEFIEKVEPLAQASYEKTKDLMDIIPDLEKKLPVQVDETPLDVDSIDDEIDKLKVKFILLKSLAYV